MKPRRMMDRLEAATALAMASNPVPESPHRMARMLPVWLSWRGHPVGAFMAAAARHPERTAVVDEDRSLTFARLDSRSNALARAWQADGIEAGTTVGILSRNAALFLEVSFAAQKIGADIVYLNTAHSGPQVAGVVADEGVGVVVHDHGLADVARSAAAPRLIGEDAVTADADAGDGRAVRPPAEPGRTIVLTSGTTGRPKGAVRRPSGGALDAAGLLTAVPLEAGDTMVVAPPLFHGLGLVGATFGLSLSSTVVLRRQFEPEATLRDITNHHATVLIAVPLMLQRILALPRRVLDSYDVSSLRVVLSGGSALPAQVALDFMDRFGDVLYNFYGSTEASFATVASPRDLRLAPGTVGRSTPGVRLRIADEDGARVGRGVSGRILVGSPLRMDEYTGGTHKPVIDGLVATGDMGYLDRWGRLFVDGREDDMIVSGGENVFPAEVEATLTMHPAVAEAAVVGVEDAEFGQRLKAYVVAASGRRVTEDALKQHVHGRLARFKTPREVVFVDALPRNALGKVVKRDLPS
jgi:acyl-CoA synthetase (AMP-forming)/AMP-acid ligase II